MHRLLELPVVPVSYLLLSRYFPVIAVDVQRSPGNLLRR